MICEHIDGLWSDPSYSAEAWRQHLARENAITRAVGELLLEAACEAGHAQVAQTYVARKVSRVAKCSQKAALGGLRRLANAGLTKPVAGGDAEALVPAIIALTMPADEPSSIAPGATPNRVWRWNPIRGDFDKPVEATQWLSEHHEHRE